MFRMCALTVVMVTLGVTASATAAPPQRIDGFELGGAQAERVAWHEEEES